MDIRKFFNTSKRQEAERKVDPTEKPQRLELTVAEESNRTDHSKTNSVDSASESSSQHDCLTSSVSSTVASNSTGQSSNRKNDIRLYLDKNECFKLSQTDKLNVLTKPLQPRKNYNFQGEVAGKQRPFVYSWLEKYSPWLVYSESKKGALCLYCVLFPQPVLRGVQGAFIMRPCTKYKQFYE